MPISITNVSFHKSSASAGGNSSLGGVLDTTLSSQTTTQPAVITGLYISQAFGNPLGGGGLAYNPTSQTISWKPSGSATTYISSPVTGDGTIMVGDAVAGMLLVTVTFTALPTSYKTETITVSSNLHTVFGPTTALQALVGDIQYRCLYFRNNHPTLTANDVRLYLHAPPALPQTIGLGLDPAGVGNGTTTGVAQTIASATTAPAGVTFSSPTQAVNGIVLGSLGPNQAVAFWQKRTVPEMAYGPLSIISTTVGVALVG